MAGGEISGGGSPARRESRGGGEEVAKFGHGGSAEVGAQVVAPVEGDGRRGYGSLRWRRGRSTTRRWSAWVFEETAG